MKFVLSLMVCAALVAITLAYPYRIPEEYEEEPRYRFVPLRRMSRRADPRERVFVPRPRPVPVEEADLISVASEPVAAETGYGHSGSNYDYVDYGAYTGGYGAFGWYTDHPVYSSHGHY